MTRVVFANARKGSICQFIRICATDFLQSRAPLLLTLFSNRHTHTHTNTQSHIKTHSYTQAIFNKKWLKKLTISKHIFRGGFFYIVFGSFGYLSVYMCI